MVRQTVRRLRRSPGLTITALLTFAVGIGAAAAMFSVVNAVLLEPLPYSESDRLVALTHRTDTGRGGLPASTAIYFTYRDNNKSFESVALWTAGAASVTGSGRPEEVRVLRTTFDFLPTLRVVPALGRGFTAAEDEPRGPRAVILTHGYWQRRFGGAAAVGTSLVIDGQPYSVVGVLPETFRFPRAADLLLPMQPIRAISFVGPLGENGIARLRPGVTLETANADVNRMMPILTATFPPVPGMARSTFRLQGDVQPLKTTVVGTLANVLWVLMGTVALLFAVASVNVTNLQIVRTDAREQELAVEVVLGASRARVVSSLLFESTLLGLGGGAIGLAIAAAGLPALLAIATNQLPLSVDVSISPTVMAFTVAISLVGGLLFGGVPALRYVRRLPAVSAAHSRTQTLTVSLPDSVVANFADARQRLRLLQDRLAAAPGVAKVGFASRVPLGDPGPSSSLFIETSASTAPTPRQQEIRFASPGFLESMGIRLVAGRSLNWTDQDGSRRVVLVSESMARREWGSAQAAIGKRIRMTPAEQWAEVVGVAGDVHQESLVEEPEATVYFTLGERLAQFMSRTVTFAVRSDRVGTPGFLDNLQQAVWSVAPELPLARTERMGDVWRRAMEGTTLTLVLIGITGTMAALLGLIGIYGVTSYVVAQRFREMGIRMALGAQAATLWRLLLGRVVMLVAVGVVLGVLGAVWLSRLMTPLLFGVAAVDPATYFVISALLMSTALVAGAIPALRVTSGAPLRALRTDG